MMVADMADITPQTLRFDSSSAVAALDRLIAVAIGNTDQSRRVADFLLAWWNGDEWGHFPIANLFGVDAAIAADMAALFAFLGQHDGAIYAEAFGRREAMLRLAERWRGLDRAA